MLEVIKRQLLFISIDNDHLVRVIIVHAIKLLTDHSWNGRKIQWKSEIDDYWWNWKDKELKFWATFLRQRWCICSFSGWITFCKQLFSKAHLKNVCSKSTQLQNYSSFPLIQKKITYWPNSNMVIFLQKPLVFYKMKVEEI